MLCTPAGRGHLGLPRPRGNHAFLSSYPHFTFMGPLDQLPVSCPGPSQHEDVLHVKCPIRMADGTTMSLLSYLFLAHATVPPLCHTHNLTLHNHLTFTIISKGRCCYYSQFADQETKARRGPVNLLKISLTRFLSVPLLRSWFDSLLMSTQLLLEGFVDALNGHEDKPQGS